MKPAAIPDPMGNREEAREHLLPITPAVWKELRLLPDAGYVFSTNGGVTPMHPTGLTTWARGIAARAGIDGFELKRVRSGVETLLASARISLHIRGQLQSHGISGVQAKHYDSHEHMAEKRHALATLYALLEQKREKSMAAQNRGTLGFSANVAVLILMGILVNNIYV